MSEISQQLMALDGFRVHLVGQDSDDEADEDAEHGAEMVSRVTNLADLQNLFPVTATYSTASAVHHMYDEPRGDASAKRR